MCVGQGECFPGLRFCRESSVPFVVPGMSRRFLATAGRRCPSARPVAAQAAGMKYAWYERWGDGAGDGVCIDAEREPLRRPCLWRPVLFKGGFGGAKFYL